MWLKANAREAEHPGAMPDRELHIWRVARALIATHGRTPAAEKVAREVAKTRQASGDEEDAEFWSLVAERIRQSIADEQEG